MRKNNGNSRTLTGNAQPRHALYLTLFFSCLGLGINARENTKHATYSERNQEWEQGGLYAGFSPEQEILEKRSRTTKVFRNSNGTLTSQTGGLKHYQDENGLWQDVDYTIVPGQTSFRNVTNEIKSYYPAVPGNGAVRMQKDGLEFSWWNAPHMEVTLGDIQLADFHPGASASGSISGGKLSYSNVYDQVSEEFVALQGGIENNTIIHALSSYLNSVPANAIVSFSQFIPLQGGQVVAENGQVQTGEFTTGRFSIRFAGREDAIGFNRIVVFDNAISREDAMLVNAPADKLTAAQRTQLDAHVYVGQYSVRFVNGGIEVAVKLPVSWLKQSSRSFPVVIDPVVTITPAGATSTFYGPMSHWYGYQRHADLYLQSEIGSFGFINSIEYNSTTGGTAGSRPTKVYMRTTSATTLSGTAAWNSATYTGTGAQLCLDANTDQGSTTGWKMLTMSTAFTYSQDNLMIMVYDAWGGSGSAKYYNIASPSNRQAYKRQDGTDPGDGTATSVESYLPEIRITYTPLYPPNNSGVTALVAPLNQFCSNSAKDVYVRVKNLGAGSVNTAQVNWTINGVPQTAVTMSTTLTNYNDSIDVLLGSVFFPTNTPLAFKAWTYMPNGVADQDPTNDSLSFSITPGMDGVNVQILPRDTIICQNATIRLDAGTFPNNPIYIWNTGALTQTLDVAAEGTYSVKVQNNMGCADRDTVHVSVYPNPVANSIAIIDNGDGSFSFNVIGAQNITSYEWDFNDGSTNVTGTGIPGQQLHTFTAPGEYNVTLTLRNACGEIVITRLVKIEDSGTGIDALSALQQSVHIFPNPGKESVTISGDGKLKMNHIEIYNLMGQKIYAAAVKTDQYKVDVTAFSAGIYTIMVDTDKGKVSRKLEVVK